MDETGQADYDHAVFVDEGTKALDTVGALFQGFADVRGVADALVCQKPDILLGWVATMVCADVEVGIVVSESLGIV